MRQSRARSLFLSRFASRICIRCDHNTVDREIVRLLVAHARTSRILHHDRDARSRLNFCGRLLLRHGSTRPLELVQVEFTRVCSTSARRALSRGRNRNLCTACGFFGDVKQREVCAFSDSRRGTRWDLSAGRDPASGSSAPAHVSFGSS